MSTLQLVLLGSLCALAVGLSLPALWKRHTYGAYRFLAFAGLAVLVTLNAERWFLEAGSPRQLISWVLLGGSVVLAIHGGYLLRRVGGTRARIVEETERIVECGAYRLVRHPLYGSLLLGTWGVFLKSEDAASAILMLGITACLATTAHREEVFNLERFGPAYANYMARTKMFIPWLW